ncbi:MAG: hypothetical protein S4CHLAM45_08220 [Chlamydiales bacterium]|nr:hypothetical protein [Chlamydiales bacterium]MCH9620426.1 hypothetical protein [Chlamydiales bacterium]MCH9622928.1 hypothetical protein [Chlamydiales bacterium]
MPSVDKLLNLAFEVKGMKLGLEEIRQIDKQLGSPSKQFKSIHVAGTNGKGSVCWKIASALGQAGHRVGLFTSPHLYRVNERMRIDLKPISDEKLEHYLAKVLPFNLTYFETVTMAAFLYFAEAKIDYGVIEVGMGGRLDATNIITPEVSVITSIGMDHCQYLGDTLEKIRAEKRGILKQGVPFVEAKGEFTHYEEENQSLAKQALDILGVPYADLSMVPPGRFEIEGNTVYDVAHNLPALEALFKRLEHTFPGKKFRIIAAFSADKEHEAMVQFLKKKGEVHLAWANHPRALPIGDPDLLGTFEKAEQEAKARREMLIICGSHFMMESLRSKKELCAG